MKNKVLKDVFRNILSSVGVSVNAEEPRAAGACDKLDFHLWRGQLSLYND